MLLSYHLPITDLRHFMPKKSGKLDTPKWTYPLESNRKAFMRGFGKIYRRKSDGFDEFSGGKEVCEARGVMRFNSSDPQIILSDGKVFKIDCKFRRFFVFNGSNAKIELGLTEKANQTLTDSIAIEAILEGMLKIPMNVFFPQPPHSSKAPKKPLHRREPRESIVSTLGKLKDNLSKTLLYASTSARKGVKNKDWWVKVNEPVIFMEFNKEEFFEVPSLAQLLDCSDKDVDVYKYILKNGTVSYIIKRKNHNKARAKSRSLRIILSGLHCHLSNLYLILNSLDNKIINKEIKVDFSYLESETKLLRKIFSKSLRYNIKGTQVEIPIPLDAQQITDLIKKTDDWIASQKGAWAKIFEIFNIDLGMTVSLPGFFSVFLKVATKIVTPPKP